MTSAEIIERAFHAFQADAEAVPPLTLRGGNAVDSYDEAEPFDPARDAPTDAYLEAFAFWGLAYLDARSWRHYLPKLIDYACRHPNDPAMAVEALIRSLRPPDRYPPRLATLTVEQEAIVVAFLERLALDDTAAALQGDALQALEEWWLPGARHRPDATDLVHLESQPASDHFVDRPVYRLMLPANFTSSGARDIPEESRLVEVWGGTLCGVVPTVVAVNVTPLDDRNLLQIVERAAEGLRAARTTRHPMQVRGAAEAQRMDGLTRGDSPAEPQLITVVSARSRLEVATLSIRSWPRDDVAAAIERIVSSFEIV
jgi:hypothetical protein